MDNAKWNNYHAVKNKLVNTIPVKIIDLIDSKEYKFDSISQAANYLNVDKRNFARALKRKNQVYSHYKIIKI